LPAGPNIDDFDEIIIVEGRADVLNLLKHGIRNVIALKGSKASASILDLAKKKVTILFVDGDRGGDLIIKKLADLGDLDFVAKAPSGKEVEELVIKEIHKALRAKVTWQQALAELNKSTSERKKAPQKETADKRTSKYQERSREQPVKELGRKEAKLMKGMFEELVGSRGAFVLGENLDVLGKVPVKELTETLRDISEGVFAIVMDGAVDMKLVKVAESMNISYILAKNSSVKSKKVQIMNPEV
jgi:DNA primase